MSLLQFLEAEGLQNAFAPELITAFDTAGGPALMQMFGIPPGPPIMGAPLFISAMTSAIVPPGAGLPIWLNMIANDITILMMVPMLIGSILQQTPAKGAAPAGPITPIAQTLVPSSFPPIGTDIDSSMRIAKVMLDWAISLSPAVDLRLIGKFVAQKPSTPSEPSPLPSPPDIGTVITGVLAGISSLTDAEKLHIKNNIENKITQTTNSITQVTDQPQSARSPQDGDPGRRISVTVCL